MTGKEIKNVTASVLEKLSDRTTTHACQRREANGAVESGTEIRGGVKGDHDEKDGNTRLSFSKGLLRK